MNPIDSVRNELSVKCEDRPSCMQSRDTDSDPTFQVTELPVGDAGQPVSKANV